MTIPQITTKTKVFLALCLVSLLSIVYLVWKTKPPLSLVAPTWKNIDVGRDTKEDVIKKLGPPVSSTTSALGQEILDYQSDHKNWPHQVYVNQKQTSNLVKERLLNTVSGELKTYLDKYGPPDAILASRDELPALGFKLYVFPKLGTAVNTNPTNGVVFEIWYFPPTTLEKFQIDYASEITDWVTPQTF